VYSSVDSALSSIKAGTLNLFELPEGTDLSALPSSANVVNTSSTMIYYVSMNTQTWPFNNTLVRQAMAYAIDKTGIVSLAFGGEAQVAQSVISPALSYWYNPNTVNYTLNDVKAENLLKEAGFSNTTGSWVGPNGTLTFTLLIPNQSPWIDMSTVISQNLAQIGIAIHVTQVDPTTDDNIVLGTHDYQMTLNSWRLYFDPMLFLEPSFHSTESGPNGLDFSVFKNSTVDNLIASALNQSTLTGEQPFVTQIQYAVSQQVPWINLAYGQDIWSVQGFNGWQAVPRYGLWYYPTFLGLTPTS